MKPVAQPIKLLIVNLGIMRWKFRQHDSITKEQFENHLKQVQILIEMLTIPKLRYNIMKKLNEKDVLENENRFVELIELVDKLAEESVVDEEIDYVMVINTNSNTGRYIRVKDLNGKKYEIGKNFQLQDLNSVEAIANDVHPDDQKELIGTLRTDKLQEKLEKENRITAVYRRKNEDGTYQRKRIRIFYLDDRHDDIVKTQRDITDLY